MALNEDQRREFRAKYSSAHNLRAATEKYQENPGDQEARSIVSHEIFGDDSLVANPLEVWDSVMQNDFPPLLTARNDSLRTFTVDNLTDILEGIENSDHRFMVLATAPHRPEYPDQGLNTAHGDFQRAAENYKNPNLDGIVQDLEENYEISRATLVLWSNHNRDGLKKLMLQI